MYDPDDPFDISVGNSTATVPGLPPAAAPTIPAPKLTLADLVPPSTFPLGNNPPQIPANPPIIPARENAPASDLGASPLPSRAAPPASSGNGPAPAPNLADILGDAQKASASAYGGYTPENRQELVRYMLQKQNSPAAGIGEALAGLGDAISRGAGRDTNFLQNSIKGGQETTAAALGNFDEMQKAKQAELQTGMSLAQADPTSSASKSAQTAAKPMLAAAGLSDAQIANLPANAIDSALKSATSFADAKAKLAQVAAMREYNVGLRQDQQQDKLEKQESDRLDKVTSARSGGLGAQDAKVNQSLHLMTLLDQYKDANGNYNVPASQYEELAIGLANLVAGSSGATQSMIDGIKQRTAKGDLNGALTWVTGTTQNGSTQGVLKNLRDSIERQGLQAETQRDKYLDDFAKTAPSRLDQSRLDHLLQTQRGSSIKEYLKNSATQPGQPAQSPAAAPPIQKTIGGKTYVKQNGQWFEQ